MTVRDALKEHHDSYNFGHSPGGYEDWWATVPLGPITIYFPNYPGRTKALKIHDINHLVTGYTPIEFKGEMEIAYFEYGSGMGNYGAAWFFNSLALILAIRWPKAAWKAFKRGLNSKKSLYKHYTYSNELLDKKLDDLRIELGV